MTVALGVCVFALVAAVLVAARRLDLESCPPRAAVRLWLGVLALRAALTVATVLAVLAVLPSVDLFTEATAWCWHLVVPLLREPMALEGHVLGDLTLILPLLAVLGPGLLSLCATARSARRTNRAIDADTVGRGPGGATIVSGADVLLAVAGLRRPRVVVSYGALLALDDRELAAALDHERAHVACRHRLITCVAAGLRAIGRAIPGAGSDRRELAYQLEREADGWALRRGHEPADLASAICKAASRTQAGATLELARTAVERRVEALLARPERPPASSEATGWLFAVVMSALALVGVALVAALPLLGVAALEAHVGWTHR